MEEDTMERTRPIHSRTRRSEEHTSALHGALPIYKSTAPSMLRGVPSIRRPWSSSNSDRIREDRKYCGGCHPDDPSRTGRLSCQHHATRHKWRRILWSELGLSIPEPEDRKSTRLHYTALFRSTRVLLPLCFVASLVFVGLGVPQTLTGYERIVSTVEGATQTILVGPVASLVSIMQLGTNGGGYCGANSAYPFQSPNPASDIFQIFLMLLIPTTLCFVFGQLIRKKRETRPILWGAYALFALDLLIAFTPNPPVVDPGMEVRFGSFFSTFWTVVTTAVTTGSVNASLSGLNPLVRSEERRVGKECRCRV